MNIAAPFIHRSVMTTLVMSSILLFGLMSYNQLPVSDLPNVDRTTIEVSARVPGASPETMASAVATVLERQFSTIAGIDSMVSASSQGATTITLEFSLNRDIDAAAQDVQSAIARASRQLPRDMPTPPSYQKVNPADQPILMLVLTSPTLPLYKLNEYGETLVAQRISMIDGVAQVQVYGAQKYAVRIQLNPHALASKGIGLDEVVDAVGKQNVNLPTGLLYGPSQTLSVQVEGQLLQAKAYEPIIVAYRNNAPVRLGELGRVLDSVENDKVAAWYCTTDLEQRALFLAVQRQPGRNTVEVADRVKQAVEGLRKQIPASVQLELMIDRSQTIRDSFNDVKETLLLTLVLVVLVIFLFLRNVSATVIPSTALPMSLIGTFVVMYLLDYSLDNLSLMALTLSVGFVVDDAIVMLENIVRHMEMGKDRHQAALDGSKEVGFTIVSMTLSLAAVFIPVLFMGGLMGRLFREFAVTIGVAVLISGFVSLTLTPMLCAKFLKPSATMHHGRIYAWTERGFQRILGVYGQGLRWVLARQRSTMVLSLLVLAATVYLFIISPRGFIPTEDRNQITINTEGVEGVAVKTLFALQRQMAAIVRQDPDVEAFMSSAGSGRPGSSSNQGRMMVRLKHRSERELTADQLIQKLRPKLAVIPGITASPQNPPTIQIGARSSKSQYQYTLQGPDTDVLYPYASLMMESVKEIEGVLDVKSDMQLKNPELNVAINRDMASSLGISVEQIENTLFDAYGSRQVSTIYAPDNQYQVIVELLPEYQMDAAALSLLHMRSTTGGLVPLAAVVQPQKQVGPMTINHSGQFPSVTLSFNLNPDVALGDVVKKIDEIARAVIPDTISTSFQGTAQAFQSSMKGMGILLILAIVVIYIVLGILYENFWHPVTILSALPFAGVGALLTLIAFNMELNIYAYVGIIMLVGLVKKNGIMMIDFALEAQRKEGKSPEEAIVEACLIRFRPIMMTTMAALMAGLPIALGMGAGAEARRPLGLAVVGGLLFSQTLTLFVTPVFYLYMERWQEWLRQRRRLKAET